MEIVPNTIYLRPSLGFTGPPKARNNLVAFTPDILPLYKAEINDPDQLTASYPGFVAQTLQTEEYNHVYIRGRAEDDKQLAHVDVALSTFTNELILWPQVLHGAKSLGHIPLNYNPDRKNEGVPGAVSSTKHVNVKPPGRGGRHDVLFANIINGNPVPNAKNWRELCETIGSNPSYAFYNVSVVDPVFDVYTFATRLRFFDDGQAAVQVELDIECLGIPQGYELCLFSLDPSIRIDRTPIVPGTSFGLTLNLADGFDTLITVQIHNVNGRLAPTNASVSLVAHVVYGEGRVKQSVIIGAEHIVFHAGMRLSRGILRAAASKPAFYFRTKIGDTDVFPRKGNVSRSPDIQPLGTSKPSISVTDSLNDYNVDVSSQEGVDIHINDSNYIYLRGNCTRAVEMQTSLYAVPNTMVLYPEMYGNEPVMDVGPDGRKIAIRDFTTKTPGPHVIDDPFNFFNPTSPASKGFDHYCLIAEARIPGDVWPHEDPLPTGYDITNWLLNNPNIAQRNVYWTESFDDPTQIWQTNASIPEQFSPTDVFELRLSWTDFPVGGSVQMTTTGPVNVDIPRTPVTAHDMNVSRQFTGVEPPYSITVTISWWQGDGLPRTSGSFMWPNIQQRDDNFHGKFDKIESAGVENATLVVGPDYPNLRGSYDLVSRHSHLNGSRLLGAAHPIQELPRAGVYEDLPVASFYRPVGRLHTLGADMKGISSRIMM